MFQSILSTRVCACVFLSTHFSVQIGCVIQTNNHVIPRRADGVMVLLPLFMLFSFVDDIVMLSCSPCVSFCCRRGHVVYVSPVTVWCRYILKDAQCWQIEELSMFLPLSCPMGDYEIKGDQCEHPDNKVKAAFAEFATCPVGFSW